MRPFTPRDDDAIRRAVATPGGLARLSRTTGRDWRELAARANEVAPLRHVRPAGKALRPWEPEELRILRQGAEDGIGARGIVTRLKVAGSERTRHAVIQRLRRMGMSARIDNPDIYSAADLALLMGINGATVVGWIDRHGLPAQRHHGPKGVRYSLRRKHVRTWLVEHAGVYDPRRLVQDGDFLWFVDLIGTGRRRGP